MPNCAIYARVSSEQQAEKGLSIPAQLHELHAYAEKNGWPIYKEYIDEALSGRTDDRDAFQELIAEVKKKNTPFSILLIHKYDRFGRLNREETILYKGLLKREGIKLISISEPIVDGPIGIFIEGLIELMAEFYSLNLGQETRKGLKEVARRGYFTGGRPPYGYRLADVEGPGGQKKHILEADPITAPVIARIFEDYGNRGGSFGSIVEWLNAENIPSPTGKKWGRNALYAILTNEVYRGARVYNKRTFQRGSGYTKKKMNPAEEWIVTEDAHSAIVSRELWQKVQAEMRLKGFNPQANSHARSDYLFSGIARCAACGGPISGLRRTSKGNVYRHYICATGHNQMNCTRTRGFRADAIEKAVLAKIRNLMLNPDSIQNEIRYFISKYQSAEKRMKRGKTALQREGEKLDRQIRLCTDAILETGISPALSQRLKELESRRAAVAQAIEESENIARVMSEDDIRLLLRDMAAHLDSGDPAEVKAWLHSLVQDFQLDIEAKRASFTLKVPVAVSESLLVQMVAGACYGQKVQTRKRDFFCEVVSVERVYC